MSLNEKNFEWKNDNSIKIILKKSREIVPNCEVYLFGSRARGDNQIDSDYDILLVIKESMSPKEKMNTRSLIRSVLAKERIYADIIIQSQAELEKKKSIPGNIIYYAMEEAVIL